MYGNFYGRHPDVVPNVATFIWGGARGLECKGDQVNIIGVGNGLVERVIGDVVNPRVAIRGILG